MAVVYNIKGTTQTEFQVGKGGPKLVKSGNDLDLQTPGGSVTASSLSTSNLDFNGYAWPDPAQATGGQFVRFTGTAVEWYTIPTPASFTPITATGTGSSQNISLPYGGLTVNDVNVYVNGLKFPTSEYTISDTTLTITTNGSGDAIEITCPTSYVAGDGGGYFPVSTQAGLVLKSASTTRGDVEWGAFNLNALDDVTITTATANQVLQYNGSGWVNATLTLTTNLDSLTDVVLTSPSTNQLLQYNGTNWVNATVSSLPTGGTANQVLAKNSNTNYDVVWSSYLPVAITTVSGTSYTLVVGDTYVRCTNSGSTTVTVPPNSSAAFPVGAQLTVVRASGAVAIAAGSGVTILNSDGMNLRKAGSACTLTKVGTDSWDFAGDVVIS